jgi:hypothetical protein
MRFNKLIFNGKEINKLLIEKVLKNTNYNWLLKCEFDDANIEIKDNILYWNNGVFYYGDWKWGVVKNGDFRYCNWHGGIFLNGSFKGIWHNGVFKKGTFKGKKLGGKFETEIV